MKEASQEEEPLAFLLDASVLINLAHTRHLQLLGALAEAFLVPESVVQEIRERSQRQRLKRALRQGFLRRIDPEGNEVAALYGRLRQKGLGSGESACLALAEARGWAVATDDRRAIREATKRDLEYIDTPGILLLGLQRELITLKEADSALEILREHRFKTPFNSFAELL